MTNESPSAVPSSRKLNVVTHGRVMTLFSAVYHAEPACPVRSGVRRSSPPLIDA